ncbi:hypothetical protein [Marinicella rhabdoformis]|uniref:hypothetical protein n=1 Tax=Marinicella rhabdoformis TaxID=2580566 RepID=UPI0012AECEE9|nr:hypothetical protein [Marinicella rhabdoformis]
MKVIMIILTLIASQITHGKGESNQQNHDLHEHNSHHKSHEPPKPSLNQGKKWQMDEHTRKMFQVMVQRTQTDMTPKMLGEQLNQDLQKLIKGCTMTGQAHDQLHLFLTPFIPAVQALAHDGSAHKLHQVKSALKDYKNYFE